MKMLCWHVNSIKWMPRQEIKAISEPGEEGVWSEVKDCVACLTAFEKHDEENPYIVNQAVQGVKEVTGQVKVKRVVLYPYAHLSSSLSKASFAKQKMNELKNALESEGFEVHKSPFGWYKEFIVHCKGHPLAEARREY